MIKPNISSNSVFAQPLTQRLHLNSGDSYPRLDDDTNVHSNDDNDDYDELFCDAFAPWKSVNLISSWDRYQNLLSQPWHCAKCAVKITAPSHQLPISSFWPWRNRTPSSKEQKLFYYSCLLCWSLASFRKKITNVPVFRSR